MIELPTIHFAIFLLDLHIPESGSLKAKRRVVRMLRDRLRSKFNVSVAELGELDKWQRVILGVSMISNDRRFIEKVMAGVREHVERCGEAAIIDARLEVEVW